MSLLTSESPMELFSEWFETAKKELSQLEPTAMTLATATADACPSARIVLLKEWDERGFVWYTNLESRKSEEVKDNPQAAICFHWIPLERQVRIEGTVEAVSDAQADAYYQSRPRGSRIGAWASMQSQALDTRKTLEQRVLDYTEKFGEGDIPRPPFWSGWRLVPKRMEFWQQGEYRLHDRFIFIKTNGGWEKQRLYP